MATLLGNKLSRPQIGNRYGAWYLKPESWKLSKKSEPLIDPYELQEQEDLEPSEHDKELAKLHGAQTFRAFLEKHNTKVPSFMTDVIAAQDYQEKPKAKSPSKETVDDETSD
ncbi:Oidioi.mRNA.OKI2018_I69.XSR.g14278.t1.cds [Oikopleura dioica]|uniref:Oidioi.mRNA.OKI2018_I69.XSR.g14278.t1.cds n=1 Tax=Oikopleura dioica TaxID=34765 RepID=A0ABN7SB42_OIKDI|nr:Oidioi.mRNA.OKI2018_I69.XSR.g14278.t1.cds [Oikopleura dioica]